MDITVDKYKRVGKTPTYQVWVTGNGVTVMCRVRPRVSTFDFMWSERKISKEAQDYVCASMSDAFWGNSHIPEAGDTKECPHCHDNVNELVEYYEQRICKDCRWDICKSAEYQATGVE